MPDASILIMARLQGAPHILEALSSSTGALYVYHCLHGPVGSPGPQSLAPDRRGQIAPVVLVLTAADAAALAQAVQDAVQQWCPIPPADHPCCPGCLATAALAYGALTVESTLVVQDAACLTCVTSWRDSYIDSGSVVQDA
jgi:hypothetical protein